MKAVLALAALLIASSSDCAPLPALAEGDCHPLADELARAAEAGVTVKVIPAESLDEAIKIYNEWPPLSNEHFDAARYGILSNGGAAIIYLRAGEVCGHLQFSPSSWDEVKDKLVGSEL